jgi:hypothetical protein
VLASVLTGSVTGIGVAVALAVVEPDPPPLPPFCTVACTTWPAVLNTMSTNALSASYEKVFWIRPLPSCLMSPTCVMSVVLRQYMFFCKFFGFLTLLEVSDDLGEGTGGSADDFLHNVAEVVDQEVERFSTVGDGAEETVNSADDISNKTGHVADETKQERVQVQ